MTVPAKTWEVAGIDAAFLGVVQKGNVGTGGMADTTGLSLPTDTATAAVFAALAPSATSPITVLVDAEAMKVSTVDTTPTPPTLGILTGTRGAYGTTAATHVAGTNTLQYIRDVQLPFTHTSNFNPQNVEIQFVGDADQDYATFQAGLRGVLQADRWSTDVWQYVLGATPDLPASFASLDPDVIRRWLLENATYPITRLRIYLLAMNLATGVSDSLRFELPNVRIYPRPVAPPNAGNLTKTSWEIQWTANRVKTDLLGLTIAGTLPRRGVRHILDELSSLLP